MTYTNDRLDRIESLLAATAERTAALAERQEQTQAQLDALAQRQDRFQTELAETRQEMHSNFEFLGSEVGQLTRGIVELKQQVSEVTLRVDEGFRQAERDRALTSQLIERLIEVLTERFTSNGHSE